MKIIDVFPYFNEAELLELRVSILNDYVDKFIICDANRTHSGACKDYTAKKTLIDLNLMSDKIHIIEVDLSQYDADLTSNGNWSRERAQRNSAGPKFICEDCVCIISDCDEIIDPNFVKYYSKAAIQYPDNIVRIPMVNLCGRADLQVVDHDQVPRITSAAFMCLPMHVIKNTLSELRELYTINQVDNRNIWLTDNGKVNPAGWHFSWMGDTQRLLTKHQSFMHCCDYIEDSIYTYSKQGINEFIESYEPTVGSTDTLGRTNHILKEYNIELLPSILNQLHRVKQHLLPNKKKYFSTKIN